MFIFKMFRLTIEALLENKAVLIFCPTKSEVENTAESIAKYIKYCFDKGPTNRFFSICSQMHRTAPEERLDEVVREKTKCTDKLLLKTLRYGVAFHHAGK
jgi:replicative superfamily II helicase